MSAVITLNLRRFAVAALSLLVVLTLVSYAHRLIGARQNRSISVVFDDAYMFVRYARNLHEGFGMTWNRGEPRCFGLTSLPHLFMVNEIGSRLSTKPADILSLTSWMTGLLAALGLSAAVAAAAPSRSLRNLPLAGGVIVPLLLNNNLFTYHALSGMETMLAVLCNVLLILAVAFLLARPAPSRVCLVVLAAYAVYLVRPECVVYSLFYPALSIIFLAPVARLRCLAYFTLELGALLCLDATAKLALLGDLVPLSFYVKNTSFYQGNVGVWQWNPISYLQQFFYAVFPFVLILALTVRRKHARMLLTFLVPVCLNFIYLFAVTQIMGNRARFYYPALPFVAVPAAATLWDYFLDRGFTLRSNPLLVRLLAVLVVLYSVITLGGAAANQYARVFLSPAPVVPAHRLVSTAGDRLPTVAEETAMVEMGSIVEALPAGSVVAATEVGWLGVSAPNVTIIDESGLNDSYIAHHGFSAGYLVQRAPDLVWFPHEHYTGLVGDLIDDPQFMQLYDCYPRAFHYGIAIRKDSPHRALLLQLVNRSWGRLYPRVSMNDALAHWQQPVADQHP